MVLAFKSLCCYHQHIAATIIIMAASSKKGKFHRRLDARIKNQSETFFSFFVRGTAIAAVAGAAAAATAAVVIT